MNINQLKLGFLFLFFLSSGLTFCQQANQVQLVTEPKDKAYKRSHIDDLKPIPFPNLRESDVFWEKRIWRMIDFKEKMNQPLYFPERPQGRWRSLMQVLWDAILAGEITAYAYDLSTDNFEELIPMTASQIELELSDTAYVESADPNDANATTSKKVVKQFEPQEVLRLKVKEDWIFDKQRSEMQVRIVGICPVIELRDPTTGDFRGYKSLFWLYFPEIRPTLAKYESFNRQNSAKRLTYDQLFLQRRFSSTIIKEDNVYDRYIGDYALGIDALQEAETIKNSIRDFEAELWVY